MSRLLAVPNFSTAELPEGLDLGSAITLHYAGGDPDHGRAVVAFSGEAREVGDALLGLCARLLPTIDLRSADGAHPRVGALDVAPFVDLDGGEEALGVAERFGMVFARRFEVPVTMYEANARGETPLRLPQLRSGDPAPVDYGPKTPHPVWGRTVVGARGPLVAANLVFAPEHRARVRAAAKTLRARRDAGDPALEGVRTLAFDLPSRGLVQLSFNLTCPDATAFDAVAETAETEIGARGISTELIGVIRERHVAGARRLTIAPEQIVP